MVRQSQKAFLALGLLLSGAHSYSFTVGNNLDDNAPLIVIREGLKIAYLHVNLSGHEEITRQAIILTKEAAKQNNIPIPDEISKMAFLNLEPAKFGLIGSEATNPLIQGNYATDFPFTRSDYVVNIPQYWNLKNVRDDMDWQNHPQTQRFHFLRDHLDQPDAKGSILEGQRKSCLATRDAIIRVTQEASSLFRKTTNEKGKPLTPAERLLNVKKSMFFVGHATHMIQDSFSEAHGKRKTREHNHDVTEMCYFGHDLDIFTSPLSHETRLNSCHHSIDEIIRDGLWLKDSKGINKVKSEWPGEPVVEDSYLGITTCLKNFGIKLTDNDTCIKHTPRLARTATAKYLLVLINFMKNNHAKVAKKEELRNFLIDHLFEGSLGLKGLDETMPNGIMRCDNLPD